VGKRSAGEKGRIQEWKKIMKGDILKCRRNEKEDGT